MGSWELGDGRWELGADGYTIYRGGFMIEIVFSMKISFKPTLTH
jgi:hypothetical protein